MVGNIGLLVNVDIARQKPFKIASIISNSLFNMQLLGLLSLLVNLHPKNIEERKSPGGQIPPRKKHTGEKIGRQTTEPL